VVQERYERLVELQERISTQENARQNGRVLEVLIADGEGRKDGATRRVSGRAADNRLVHLALPPHLAAPSGAEPSGGAGKAVPAPDAGSGPADPRATEHLDPDLPRPGDLVTVRVTHGAPHHLVADSALDGGPYAVRRTRAGDAWAARQRADHDHQHGAHDHGAHDHGAQATGPVVLGMPSRRP